MSLLEIIKKLRLAEIKVYLKDFLKLDYSPTKIKIDKQIINIFNNITPKQIGEVKRKSLETAKEIPELPNYLKEVVAKTIVASTMLINLPALDRKLSKGFIKLDPDVAISLLIRCEKCSKFFGSRIGGNLKSLVSSTFINNTHQCQYCGNMQLAKDNSDYFVLIKNNL